MLNQKKLLGQYYTIKNPFNGGAFELWNTVRPKDCTIIEPFAGAGNLFPFMPNDKWDGFDLEPKADGIKQQDTIKNYPTGYRVAITNPPYLAKNSLKRKKGIVNFKHEDLYLDCTEVMLNNCEYVVAIIPSTFYGTKLFRERLIAWDKLDYKLFNDTDVPVGVAYFGPDKYETKIYVNGEEVNDIPLNSKNKNLKFNVENGNYVLTAIDNTKQENISIKKVDDTFNRQKFLKNTSRNYSLFYSEQEINCDIVNKKISDWRKLTKDFHLTSFKSLMKCGKYRKRIGFDTLKYFITDDSLICK